MKNVFPARYASVCSATLNRSHPIRVGDAITRYAGGYAHESCAMDAEMGNAFARAEAEQERRAYVAKYAAEDAARARGHNYLGCSNAEFFDGEPHDANSCAAMGRQMRQIGARS